MNTYTVAHAMHRALDRLLVAERNDAATRAFGLKAMVDYERLREHARLHGPTDALARVLHQAAERSRCVEWAEVPPEERDYWRGMAQAVLFSGIVTA